MIEGYNPVLNSLLGTLLTWGMTAAGAALVFVLPKGDHRELLDGSLGFAAGVMIAASFWSLLGPSIEKAEELGYQWVWFPAATGFLLGGVGIAAAETFLPEDADDFMQLYSNNNNSNGSNVSNSNGVHLNGNGNGNTHDSFTNGHGNHHLNNDDTNYDNDKDSKMRSKEHRKGMRRILLLVLAITIHNFPEGLAVGVGFGAVETGGMTIHEARALAWGIGLQNFPEGLAVSMPLYRQGLSRWRSFWYGQLSGMVEPIAGVLGALLIQYANPVLPYALGFAAGAMIFVVVDDLIPEVANASNASTTRYATWGCMIGFVVMMVMDVALG